MSLGPVVHEGRVRYLSPSGMEKLDATKYGGCERRWWYRYVHGRDEGRRIFTDVGQKVHSQIEHYLRTGETAAMGEIARSGLRFLPKPGPDLLIELGFGEHVDAAGRPVAEEDRTTVGRITSPVRAGDVPMVGRIDLMHRRGVWVDDDGQELRDPGCAAETHDHKTTKQIEDDVDLGTGWGRRGLAKSGDEIARTWQMLCYGKVAARRWPDVDHVRLSHGYMQTGKAREASKRSALLTVAELDTRWDAPAARLAETAKRVARLKVVEEVPANLDACGAFGGCPHRAYCPRDAREAMVAAFGRGGAMNLLEKMRANAAAAKANPPAAATAQPAEMPKTTVAPPTPAEVKAEVQKLEAEEAAAVAAPDAPAPSKVADLPADVAPPSGFCANSENTRELDGDALVSKKYACSCGQTFKVKPKKLGDGKWYAMLPKHEMQPAAPPPAPAKVEKVADALATVASAPASEIKAAVECAAPAPANDNRPTTGLVLYLDAGEDGVRAERLERYAEGLCRDLEQQYGAADVRCAPDGPLSFGKWKGALAAYARTSPPRPAAYECSSSSEVGLVVFEALCGQAARVVRGRR